MSILARYSVRAFFSAFVPVFIALIALYLLIDFIERLDILLENNASASAAARYFIFKIPLMVTQMLPASALIATLFSVGLMSRHNEIIALRAAGVSLSRSTAPLILCGLILSAFSLAWSETAVPYFTHQFQHINRVEIRKRGEQSVWSDRGVWYRGALGFYSIEHLDSRAQMLHGLTIFRVTPDFELQGLTEVESAHWNGQGWDIATAWDIWRSPAGQLVRQPVAMGALRLPESIDDFREVHLEAEELSYQALSARVERLASRGISTAHYRVDLHLKLALPFAVLAFMWAGLPLAGRIQRHTNMAATFAGGLVLGFSYWILLGFTRSLGDSGVLSPLLAVWTPNLALALAGSALYLVNE